MTVFFFAVAAFFAILFGGALDKLASVPPKPPVVDTPVTNGQPYCISKEDMDQLLTGPPDFSFECDT